VGAGSLESKLREANVPIEFRGAVPYDGMPEIYQKTSVLVLPSYMEGFPCTCVEALSCCVPVVATDVGDTREIIVDEETGFLTKPGDAEEMASRIIRILIDNGLRKKLGENGRAHVEENFSYKAVTEKIIEIYRKGGR